MSLPSHLVRKVSFLLTAMPLSLMLAACSPHPGSGKWQATGENRYGIDEIAVHFDGKAEFSTVSPENADMHCFWGATDGSTLALQCRPSTDPERDEFYQFAVGDDGFAEFSHGGSVVGRFSKTATH